MLMLAAGLVLAGCLAATARQLRFWQNSETLFAHSLAVTKDNGIAQNSLGLAFLQQGRVNEAIAQFQKALELQPDYVTALNNLGVAFIQSGRIDEAIERLDQAVAIKPNFAVAHKNLGRALLLQGRLDEAIAQFQKAIEFQPRNFEALNNLAWVLATSPEASIRNGARAVELAERADQLSGGRNPAIIGTLAAAYAEAGRFPEAIAAVQRSLQLASVRNDVVRATALQNRLDHYEAGAPFRDLSLTNRLPQSPAPLK
jgi:tetratricopeptide (TPR) repeat protein